jgi:hypothetical protein
MHQNNSVYKGYRLTAKVSRLAVKGSSTPSFTATVMVVLAGLDAAPEDQYSIPRFVDGGFVFSPGEAVNVAVIHGRTVVDSLRENALQVPQAA